jgi:hypothetical protein
MKEESPQMRITPSHPRLRATAIICMIFGAWALLQSSQIAISGYSVLLAIAVGIAAIISLAIGISFWLLGTDRRAGVVFDSKGLMLNLGHSAAFVSWQNIAGVGVSHRRSSLLTLGSNAQIGILLKDTTEYIQSYERRIPASRGALGHTVRLIQRATATVRSMPPLPHVTDIESLRRRTGYDLLIPESLLGGRSTAFVELVESYLQSPYRRRMLQIRDVARSTKVTTSAPEKDSRRVTTW